MLYKIVGIILSALFIATVQISTASAGCHGGHGGGFHAYQSKAPSRVALQQSRARKAALAQARAAAKQKKAAQLARAEKKAEATKVAEAAPAPVKEETKTVAESTDASTSEVTVASAAETCTRFNAQIGTTITTTDCAKQ